MSQLVKFLRSINRLDYIDLIQNSPNTTIIKGRVYKLELNNLKLEKFPTDIFTYLPYLSFLDLSSNHISQLPEEMPVNSQIRIMNLGKNRISSVPTGFLSKFIQLEELYLYKNELSEFPNLDSDQLKIIDLSYNNIKNLDLTKQYIPHLRRLNLNGNRIQSIMSMSFSKYKFLLSLQISENKISNLDFMMVLPNTLREIDLSFNEIAEITDSSLYRCLYLEELNLSNNKISLISEVAFLYTTKLKYLNLSKNDVKEIKTNTFMTQTILAYLNLSNNKLEGIPSEIFKNTKLLQSLFLSNNKIEELRSEIFTSLTELRELSLSGNKLLDLNWNCFKYLNMLENLDLASNFISSVPYAVLDLLNNLNQINLKKNPFSLNFIEKFQTFLRLTGSNYLIQSPKLLRDLVIVRKNISIIR